MSYENVPLITNDASGVISSVIFLQALLWKKIKAKNLGCVMCQWVMPHAAPAALPLLGISWRHRLANFSIRLAST